MHPELLVAAVASSAGKMDGDVGHDQPPSEQTRGADRQRVRACEEV